MMGDVFVIAAIAGAGAHLGWHAMEFAKDNLDQFFGGVVKGYRRARKD